MGFGRQYNRGVTEKQHPLVKQFAESAKSMGAAVCAGKSFAVARLPKGTLEIRVDARPHHATHLLWTIRRKIVAQLDSAPVHEKLGLRAALRGADMLLRATFEKPARGKESNKELMSSTTKKRLRCALFAVGWSLVGISRHRRLLVPVARLAVGGSLDGRRVRGRYGVPVGRQRIEHLSCYD